MLLVFDAYVLLEAAELARLEKVGHRDAGATDEHDAFGHGGRGERGERNSDSSPGESLSVSRCGSVTVTGTGTLQSQL